MMLSTTIYREEGEREIAILVEAEYAEQEKQTHWHPGHDATMTLISSEEELTPQETTRALEQLWEELADKQD